MAVLLEFWVTYLLKSLFSLFPASCDTNIQVVTKKYVSQWNIEVNPNCLQVRDKIANHCFLLLLLFFVFLATYCCQGESPGGGGDGGLLYESKRLGMVVVVLRDINRGFWSHLGC